jgi:hypothetical protein
VRQVEVRGALINCVVWPLIFDLVLPLKQSFGGAMI